MQAHTTMLATTPAPARHKVSLIAREFASAMLVTHAPAGGLHARPMTIVKVEPEAMLWFATRAHAPKVAELDADQHVLVVMQEGHRNLTISGRARVIRDAQLARELWSDELRLWFRGPDDPELLLILVQPDEAEYWVMSGASWAKLAVDAVKAYVRDQPLRGPEPGQHEKLFL